jgi:peptidoglycan/xylan/chitin deacetylase (PgdA/CDA1 family)
MIFWDDVPKIYFYKTVIKKMANVNKMGVFVISLDFELFWGMWDVSTIENYGANVLGVKQAIPAMLNLFEKYNIEVTFATVGFLFAKNYTELSNSFPDLKPNYTKPNYNVYKNGLLKVGNDETDDAYHFGYSLLQQIKKGKHEIGTHTFSHYYCLEDGQSIDEFDADIKAAVNIAKEKDISINSIVFPRNQINENYLSALKNNGINCFRGNPTSWIYKPRKHSAENIFIRLCRLIDAYLPIFGYNTFVIEKEKGLPINVPGSRFLKPYNIKLKWLEKWKIKRILNEMTVAAKRKELYHLWWHPHNFGLNTAENIAGLEIILAHYKTLEKKYGFKNCTMKDAAAL